MNNINLSETSRRNRLKFYKNTVTALLFIIFVFVLFAPLLPSNQANRTETVFVYGTLTNPWIRSYACRCRTGTTPAVLPGYQKIGLNISPASQNSVQGALIMVDADELKLIDNYENVPNKYRREKIEIANSLVWVYILNK